MRLTIKQGDTRHAIRALLKTVDGVAIDLTTATIRFKMANRKSVVVVDREASVETDGTVQIVFNKGETDVVGLYNAEFLVTYADLREETFPHKGKIEINVESRIGGI